MIQNILEIISPNMIILGIVLCIFLCIFSLRYSYIIFALGLPVFMFSGRFKEIFPISVSLLHSLFFLTSIIGIKINFQKNKLMRIDYLFLILASLMLISYYYSPSKIYGFEKLLLFIFTVLPIIIILPRIINTFNQLKYIYYIIIISSCCYFIISFIIAIMGNWSGRFMSLNDEIVSSQNLGSFFVILLIILPFINNKIFKYFLIIIGLLCFCLILLTGTRAVIIGSILTIPFYLWFFGFNIKKERRTIYKIFFYGLIIIIIMISSIKIINTLQKNANSEVYYSRLTYNKFFILDDFVNPQSRFLNYIIAINAFKQSPLIGIGIGGYKDEFSRFTARSFLYIDPRQPSYPHNIFLEFLSEQGFLGFLLIIGIIVMSIKIIFILREKFIKKYKHWTICFASCFFFYGLIISQFSLDVPRMIYLWWGIGLLLSVNKIFK